jgi:hypothetical protein
LKWDSFDKNTVCNKVGICYASWIHDRDADFVPFLGRVEKLGFTFLKSTRGPLQLRSGRSFKPSKVASRICARLTEMQTVRVSREKDTGEKLHLRFPMLAK